MVFLKRHLAQVVAGAIVLLVTAVAFGFWWNRGDTIDSVGGDTQPTVSLELTTVQGMVEGGKTAQTVAGESEVGDDGSFSMPGLNSRQLVFANNKNGTPLYVGFIDPQARSTIGSGSTASAMLFASVGGFYLPYEGWAQALELVETFVAQDALAAEIERIASTDSDYLIDDNDAFATVLESATSRFLASLQNPVGFFTAPTAYAQELSLRLDTQEKSGVRIDPGFMNEMTFVNKYRRPVRIMLYEIGYSKDGEETVYDEPRLETIFDLNSVTKLADLASTAVELLMGKVHYGERASDPIKVIPDTTDADVTYYRVLGLGWGNNPPSISLTEKERAQLDDVFLMTGVQEILIPVFTWVLSFKDVESAFGPDAQQLTLEITKWFTGSDGMRAVLPPLQRGDLKTAGKNMMEFVAKSKTVRDGIANFIVDRVAQKLGKNIVESYVDNAAKVFATPLKTVDLVMKYFDGGVLSAHFAEASQGEEWIVAMRPPRVSLDPPAAQIQAPTNQFFKVIVQDAPASASFEYEWSHENTDLGKFVGSATDPHRYTSENALGIYQAHEGEGTDAVSVKASIIDNRTGTRQELGSATAVVEVAAEEHCGKGSIELPPEYKLTYVTLDAIDKPIFFSTAGSNVHEALEIVPPPGEEFSLITWASFTPDVEFYRDIVDNGTDYDFTLEPKACNPDHAWDCFNTIPIKIQRYLVTVPKGFTMDPHLFPQHFDEEGNSADGRGIGTLSPIYENNGDGTPTISYTCKIGRWDGSTQY